MTEALLSITPAVLAIVLAVVTRNVIMSLFSAVALAGVIHHDGAVVTGVVHAVDSTIVGALADADHAKTILFTVLIGAMVGMIGKSGATHSVVRGLAKRAKSPRSAQVIAWLSGLVVFFDDYANCMIVGSAMGPLCDRYKVSRAKLAYIVDSTAAPVASLALVSTWVGFEVGVIEKGLVAANVAHEPYSFFVMGWGYRFYPILALLFVGLVAVSGRDFGPMRRVSPTLPEADEASGEADESGAPWWVAVVPVVTLVAVTLGVLWSSGQEGVRKLVAEGKLGESPPLFRVLEQSDGYGAIMQGSFFAALLALALVLGTRALTLKAATDAAIDGMKLMFEALIVLVLAWSLSTAMKELNTPDHMVSLLGGSLDAWLLPTLVFLLAAAISFAVGSSYATMGVLMPMVIPLAFKLSGGEMMIPLAASGSVLAGACFGDHCSPISDTTVLSSIGCGSDHLVHVRTQLPYAIGIGVISVVFGTLPAGLGVSPWICLPIALVASYGMLRIWGKPSAVSVEEH